jgi:hypothetical protein
MRTYIKVGTRVNSNHGVAKVQHIEFCEKEGMKEGVPVEKIFVKDKDRCVFDLDNGHWAYGYQVSI